MRATANLRAARDAAQAAARDPRTANQLLMPLHKLEEWANTRAIPWPP
jgi:hypothetical protein